MSKAPPGNWCCPEPPRDRDRRGSWGRTVSGARRRDNHEAVDGRATAPRGREVRIVSARLSEPGTPVETRSPSRSHAMRIVTPLITLALGGLLVGATLCAQDAAMAMPRPGAQHAMLKEHVGTWDAAFKMHMGPQTVEDQATMTYTMLGDFWLVGEYEGHFMGGPFSGHEMTTSDPATKEFVTCWIDSTSPTMTVMKGTWDATSKTMTQKSTEIDAMSGAKSIGRMVSVDADTIKYSMTPEGAPAATMEITYTRKK
ncbi:MAG TPA: hypothetical protein DHV08_07365 [Rhodocyclaceae bacterium]|nr:hypothetical protein [Rhodocyclaceae bacterium]